MTTFTSVQDGDLRDPRTWGGNADASHFAQAVGITSGTLNSTNLDLVRNADGQKMIVTELAGQTWRVSFDFDTVPASLLDIHIHVKGHYDGNVAHVVKPQIYNWNSATWRTLNATFESIATDLFYGITASVLASEISGGQMRIGVYHSTPGAPGHYFYIDKFFMETHDPRPSYEDSMDIYHRVMMNVATQYDFYDVVVQSGGIAEWPTDRDTEFSVASHSTYGLRIEDGGTLRIGYPATPVETSYVALLNFPEQFGSSRYHVQGLAGHSSYIYGSPDYPGLRKTTLATYWNTGRTMTVNGDASMWKPNQFLIVSKGRKDRYGHYYLDWPNYLIASVGPYDSANDTTDVTLASELLYQSTCATHFGDAEIWNISRNVKFDVPNFQRFPGAWTPAGYQNHQVTDNVNDTNKCRIKWHHYELKGFYRVFQSSTNVECVGGVQRDGRYNWYQAWNGKVHNEVIYNRQETTYGTQRYFNCDIVVFHSRDYIGWRNEHYDCNFRGGWYGVRSPYGECRYERCTFEGGNNPWYQPGEAVFIDCEAKRYYGTYTAISLRGIFEGCRIEAGEIGADWNLSGAVNNMSQGSAWFTNCTLEGKFYPFRVWNKASMSDVFWAGDAGWAKPPSDSPWIIQMVTASYITFERHEDHLYKHPIAVYAQANDTTITFRVRPEGFSTQLNASNIWIESYYTTNATNVATITRAHVFSPAATYLNATWNDVTVNIAPSQAGAVTYNLYYQWWEPGAYVLIDPVVEIA